MRDVTHAFYQIQGIFHNFRAFKTEKSPHLFIDWANTKTIIPLSVGDKR